MNFYERQYFPFNFLISLGSLYTIMASKTLRKVAIKLIDEADFDSYGEIVNVTVTRLTKELHYKNKSTVSRALRQLIDMEFILPNKNNNYTLNYLVMPDPI